MKTLLLRGDDPSTPAIAAELLKKGGLVAVPTETVYGLAAVASDASSVEMIYEVKGRPESKPISVLIASMEQAEHLCSHIPSSAYALAEAFWPGPLTMILKHNGTVPDVVTAGGDTLGVRCPAHPVTLEILRQTGAALATPSANPSGAKSPVDASEVLAYFDGRIPGIVDGGRCKVGVASTIVDLTRDHPVILRQGGLSEDAIFAVLEKNGGRA